MNNDDIIAKLTLGTEATETVKINGTDIELRPLTAGELAKLQSLEKQGFVMKVGVNGAGKRQSVTTNDVDVNAGEFNKYQTEAMFKAIGWSMGIDPKLVEDFPVGVPEQIFSEVVRISHLSDSDLTTVKQFRKVE